MSRMIAVVAALALTVVPLSAQNQKEFERVLVPLLAPVIEGANGSKFTTEWGLLAADDDPLAYHGGGVVQTTDPTTTYVVPPQGPWSPKGRFIFVEKGRDWSAFASLTSYAADGSSAHTPLPVVRERDALTGRSTYGPLKTEPIVDASGHYPGLAGYRHRHTLRIYDFDSVGNLSFTVTLKSTWRSFRRADSRIVPLQRDCDGCPYYVELSLIPFFGEPWSVPYPHCCGRMDAIIEVEPMQANVRYYAFVSTTENDTQHVAIHTRR